MPNLDANANPVQPDPQTGVPSPANPSTPSSVDGAPRSDTMPPSPPTVFDADTVKSYIKGGGFVGAVALLLYLLSYLGVIGPQAEAKEAAALQWQRAIEKSNLELRASIDLRLLRIEQTLKEIQNANNDCMKRSEFELYIERFGRLNPQVQIPDR